MHTADQIGLCYVMMPLRPKFEGVLANAIDPAVKEAALVRKGPRMDPMAAGGVFDQIRQDIAASAVCIADLTGNNPNVAAEIGIALAAGKPVVLITCGDMAEVPFDFRHYCILQYEDTDVGHEALSRELCTLLTNVTASGITDAHVLRQMLLPASLGNHTDYSIMATSPLSFREARRSGGGFSTLRPTSSDNVGIRGLLRAFGLLEGLNNFPEVINPGDYRDEALRNSNRGFNLYCIASPKANRWTGLLLDDLKLRWTPGISFVPDAKSDDLRDVRVVITRGSELLIPPGYRDLARTEWDFGILLRAPNPYHPDRLSMVLAGRSALGTQAACTAATDPQHIRTLKKALTGFCDVDLDDHRQAFLAVVSMQADPKKLHQAIPESLRIASVERLTTNGE